MSIYDSKIWRDDLDELVRSMPWLSALRGKRVLITGATGLICSAIVDVLQSYNDRYDAGIIVLAAGRKYEGIAARFGGQAQRHDFRFVPYDALKTDNKLEEPCDYIIHGAGNASPGMIMKEPTETMLSNIVGIHHLLEYAGRVGAKRVLYISSSEVYGEKKNSEPFQEDQYGSIDLLNPRNAYSVAKRAAETLCVSYSVEYGVETVIVRPGHIYGPTASQKDNRVSSAWAYDVARKQDIVMKSDGLQLRSYCYCLDCASAMLKVLISGQNMCAYNISNPQSIITIKEMAEILTDAAGVQLRMEQPTEQEKKSFNPMSNSSLDSTKLEALGWRGLFNAQRGLTHTVQILRERL